MHILYIVNIAFCRLGETKAANQWTKQSFTEFALFCISSQLLPDEQHFFEFLAIYDKEGLGHTWAPKKL